MKSINIGIIGLGQRGKIMLDTIITSFDDIKIGFVCDGYEDRTLWGKNEVEKMCGYKPNTTCDPYELIKSEYLDCVMIFASWEAHIPLAVEAMKAGKIVGLEVGGAYSVEDCHKLVKTYEDTKTPIMMLENCCYGKYELMLLDIMREKKFGTISHCTGAYGHDLRSEIAGGIKNRHYRLRNYISRNCDNYPTHSLGPIAKLLGINNGNRMVSLVSVASAANGMTEYIRRKFPDDEHLVNTKFAQGDIVTSIIKCVNGETITLTLDTTLPRFYSRGLTVRGTLGGFCEDNRSVFFDDISISEENEFDWKVQWGNAEKYFEKNKPVLWEKFGNYAKQTHHDGMDYMVLRAFFDSVKNGNKMPIDVYDTATWMAVTALSEISIANNTFVDIPDFTNGEWAKIKKAKDEFSLCLY